MITFAWRRTSTSISVWIKHFFSWFNLIYSFKNFTLRLISSVLLIKLKISWSSSHLIILNRLIFNLLTIESSTCTRLLFKNRFQFVVCLNSCLFNKMTQVWIDRTTFSFIRSVVFNCRFIIIMRLLWWSFLLWWWSFFLWTILISILLGRNTFRKSSFLHWTIIMRFKLWIIDLVVVWRRTYKQHGLKRITVFLSINSCWRWWKLSCSTR